MSSGPIGLAFHDAGVSLPGLEQGIEWVWPGSRLLGRDPLSDRSGRRANRDAGARWHADRAVSGRERRSLPDDRRSPHGNLMTHGNKHVAFQVPDIEALLTHFEADGVDVAMVMREKFGTGCFIHDCTGNLIELVQQ